MQSVLLTMCLCKLPRRSYLVHAGVSVCKCLVKNCAYLLQVTVLRDAEVQDISIFDLLVGDVMLFETGDIMPADAVIITGNTIRYTTM